MKKWVRYLIGTCVVGGGVAAALSIPKCDDDHLELTALPVHDKNGDWNFVDGDGEPIMDSWTDFGGKPTVAINGFFNVRKQNGSVSVYKLDGEPELMFDNLADAGVLADGLIPIVKKGERIAIYKKNGDHLFTLDPVDGKEVVSCSGYFMSDRLPFELADGSVGAVDKKGNVVVQPKYRFMLPFSNGYTAAVPFEAPDDTPEWVIIDKDGKEYERVPGLLMSQYHSDKAFISKDGIMHEMAHGEVLRPMINKVNRIGDYNRDYVVYINEFDEWGVVDDTDTAVIPEREYDEIYILDKDKFLCGKDNNWVIVNDENGVEHEVSEQISMGHVLVLDGRRLSKFIFTDSDIAFMGLMDNGRIYLFDKEGKKIGDFDGVSQEMNEIVKSDYEK